MHILVLEAFVGPCPPGMECRHLDGDPGNNQLENLKWGTPKENRADSVRHGTAYLLPGRLTGEDHPYAKLTAPIVRTIMVLKDLCEFNVPTILQFLDHGTKLRGAVLGVFRGQSWNRVTGLPPYKPHPSKPGRRPAA